MTTPPPLSPPVAVPPPPSPPACTTSVPGSARSGHGPATTPARISSLPAARPLLPQPPGSSVNQPAAAGPGTTSSSTTPTVGPPCMPTCHRWTCTPARPSRQASTSGPSGRPGAPSDVICTTSTIPLAPPPETSTPPRTPWDSCGAWAPSCDGPPVTIRGSHPLNRNS